MRKHFRFSMNFSEAFQQTKYLVRFSPNGRYLASCTQHRLVIRDVQTLQIMNLHTCLDPVQQVVWSPDSQFVMCGMYKRGIVQVCLVVHVLITSLKWECSTLQLVPLLKRHVDAQVGYIMPTTLDNCIPIEFHLQCTCIL